MTDETSGEAPGDTPTLTCSRCNHSWDLSHELEELQAGNRAAEQFALDHHRHTGHYPDGVTPWTVSCRRCPEGDRFLAERPATRFARTHTRHTGHAVDLRSPDGEEAVLSRGDG